METIMSKKNTSKKKKTGTIKMDNFLSPEALENIKRKKKAELQQEKMQYFQELELVIEMGNDGRIPPEEFLLLYNDICDNLNRVTAS